jgi:hypothetical protein
MRAIEICRTAALGGHVDECGHCGHRRIHYNSCRNRHCPKCGALARARWLDQRKRELLPVPYFHVVFTIPAALNGVVFHNQRLLYDLLFRLSREHTSTISKAPSSTLFTGIQYDPVLSIATLVHPCSSSQHRSGCNAGTVVPNKRVCISASLSTGPTAMATANSRFPTSIPPHDSRMAGTVIISRPFCWERAASGSVYNLPLGL